MRATTIAWPASLVLALVLAFGGSAAWASPVYHPFVKQPFYHGKPGGRAVPLHEFAKAPMRYLRSEEAYQALLAHVSEALGRPVDDAAFRSLITSDDVRLIDCRGPIATAGITAAGQVGWGQRACYPGEHLLQVRVPGGWMTIASQGCYNPVRGERPAPPPTPSTVPPEKEKEPPAAPPRQLTVVPIPVLPAARPSASIHGLIPGQTRVIVTDAVHSAACIPLYTPGATVVVPGSPIMTIRH